MLRLVVFPVLLSLGVVPSQDPQAEIRKVATDWAAACNRAESNTIAALYAPDGVLVDVDGTRAHGPAAIENYLAMRFAGPLKDPKCSVVVIEVKLLKPDLSTLETAYSIEPRDEPAVRGHAILTLSKREGRWLITTEVSAAVTR